VHLWASDNSAATEHFNCGLLQGDPVNFGYKSLPRHFIKLAEASTGETRSTSPSVGDDESEEEDTVICVRNTFINIDSGEDGLEAVEMHESGAQTWTVSSLILRNRCKPLEPSTVASHEGCRTPPACDSPDSTSEDMEYPFLLTTPTGSLSMAAACALHECHGPAAESTQRHLSPAAARPHQPSDADIVAAPEPSPTMVLLQVPLQLDCGPGTPFSNRSVDTSVAVLNQEQDPVTGCVSLQLRVLLRPHEWSTGLPLPAPLPPQMQRPPKPDAVRKQSSPGAAAKQKRDVTCCHWKKGWCKLGESCKFEHTAEMRGIDASASLVADACGGAAAVTAHAAWVHQQNKRQQHHHQNHECCNPCGLSV